MAPKTERTVLLHQHLTTAFPQRVIVWLAQVVTLGRNAILRVGGYLSG